MAVWRARETEVEESGRAEFPKLVEKTHTREEGDGCGQLGA